MILAKQILTKEALDQYIDSCMAHGAQPTVNEFCDLMGYARSHGNRVLKSNFGISPGIYISKKKSEYISANRHKDVIDLSISLGISTTQDCRRAAAVGIMVGGKYCSKLNSR